MRFSLVLLCCCFLTSTAWSQSSSERSLEETYALVRDFQEAEREAVLEEELDLSRRQANRFWPIYEQYRADMAAVQDRYAELVSVFANNYENLPDQLARQLIGDYFTIQNDMLEVRQRYVPLFLGAIPAPKLARFYQAENKIDTVAGLELALEIPLAGDSRRSSDD